MVICGDDSINEGIEGFDAGEVAGDNWVESSD